MRHGFAGSALATGLILALATAAPAQEVSVLRKHDVEQPIDIAADRVQVREKDREALFEGAVQLRQGDMTLEAKSLKVFYTRGDNNGLTIRRLDAEGNVVLRSTSETASGDWGIYDVESKVVTLGGEVQLVRGDSRIWGERLELNLETGLTTMDGARRSEERVKGRFAVPKTPAPASTPTPEKTANP
ncbi:MAG: OstA family protein [Alphaproteobacteria bacterium]|nr:MAG: OstA family protein [Alphaproteobacteria bacterium]